MRRFFVVIFLFLMTLCSFAQGEQAKILERANGTKSLVADFVQTRHLASLSAPVVSYGRLYFVVPSKMLWAQIRPTIFSISIDGNIATIKQGGGKVQSFDVSSNRIFRELSTIIVGGIRGSIFTDDKNYDVKFSFVNGRSTAILTPKSLRVKRFMTSIEVVFDSMWLAARITIFESNDSYTVVDLHSIKTNVELPVSTFELK